MQAQRVSVRTQIELPQHAEKTGLNAIELAVLVAALLVLGAWFIPSISHRTDAGSSPEAASSVMPPPDQPAEPASKRN